MLYKTPEEQILDIVKKEKPKNPQEYVDNIVRPLMIERINEWIGKCNDCAIKGKVRSVGNGNPNAPIMIIGEGVLESQKDRDIVYPYEGTDEGEYLLELLEERLKADINNFFFINICNCFCHENIRGDIIERPPTLNELGCCKVFSDAFIKAINPRVIITLGNVAMNAYNKGVINKCRGQWFNINGIPAIATYGLNQLLTTYPIVDDDVRYQYEENFVSDLKMAIDKAFAN